MAVDLDLWRHRVWEGVSTVGDKEFQRRTWVEGRGRRWISSPAEVYCGLFDDAAFEDFLHSPEVALTEAQRAAGRRLVDRMDEFDKLGGLKLPPDQILAHPVWQDAQLCADAFATLLFPDRTPQRLEE